MLLNRVRDVIGWFLVRYQKGYGSKVEYWRLHKKNI